MASSSSVAGAGPLSGGKSCLTELERRNVSYRALDELKGVDTPVEVQSALGGVLYFANDGRKLQLDCRLAVALDDLGGTLQAYGVSKVRYSGAYVYRTTRTGRLSHHALGLAIDLHDFETRGGVTLSVKADFKKNIGCDRKGTELNGLACAMKSQAYFEEFLTPDYNADHRDHLHVSVPRRGP